MLEKVFLGSRPQVVSESHKELRFTRVRQATHLFILSSISAALGIALVSSMFTHWGPHDPDFKSYIWWALAPLALSWLLLRSAMHCIRHAYLIFTPLGIEIFPLWRPRKNHHVVYWSDIDHADSTPKRLTMHFDHDETKGIILSLAPLTKEQISLLQTTIQFRTTSK